MEYYGTVPYRYVLRYCFIFSEAIEAEQSMVNILLYGTVPVPGTGKSISTIRKKMYVRYFRSHSTGTCSSTRVVQVPYHNHNSHRYHLTSSATRKHKQRRKCKSLMYLSKHDHQPCLAKDDIKHIKHSIFIENKVRFLTYPTSSVIKLLNYSATFEL